MLSLAFNATPRLLQAVETMIVDRVRTTVLAMFIAAGLSVPALADVADAPAPAGDGVQSRTLANGASHRRKDIPCTCRFDGNDFEVGDRVCIRGRMAQCGMSLNNTSWTFTDAPCPLSKLDSSLPVQ